MELDLAVHKVKTIENLIQKQRKKLMALIDLGVGVEFNNDFNKIQNEIDKLKQLLENCR